MPRPDPSKLRKAKAELNRAERKAKEKSKRAIIGRTNVSMVNRFFGAEQRSLRRISDNPHAKNKALANTLLQILLEARSGNIVAEELHQAADQKTLNRILVKVNAYEIQKKEVKLTPIEKRVFDRYAKLVNQGPF